MGKGSGDRAVVLPAEKVGICFSGLETAGRLDIAGAHQTGNMFATPTVYQVIEVTILVSLTTSSDKCEDTSIGSRQECQPSWYHCEKLEERAVYEPPLNCTALYKDKLSRCPNQLTRPSQVMLSPGTTLSVPLVTGVFLSSSNKSGQTKPILNIDIAQPTNDDVIQLLLRSTEEVSDPFYVDPYYEKFPTWKRIQSPAPATKRAAQKMQSFRSSFGNLDTCNVRCAWGKCIVSLNLYLLTIMIFPSERQNLPGQSLTYQVTSHNRRVLPDAKENQWKPNIMTAVLPDHRGIHVVFEPLPRRFVSDSTFYIVSLQDWETWELILNTTIMHNKADAYYSCIFDFHESEGDYEVMIQYENCQHCPYDTTWIKSADFALPAYTNPYHPPKPEKPIPPERGYMEVSILAAVVTALLLTVIAFLCRRNVKVRQHRDRRSSEETLVQNNQEVITPPSREPNRESLQHHTSKDSIPSQLRSFNYPEGYIDDVVLNTC